MAQASLEPHEIREIRHGLQLTQEQMAERLGVTRATVSRWEMHRSSLNARGPTKTMIQRIQALR